MEDTLDNLDSTQRSQLMREVQTQIAVANTHELLRKMTEKCFNKCINKPGSSLDSSEQRCLAMCMDRFMDSWYLVMRTYADRLNRDVQGS